MRERNGEAGVGAGRLAGGEARAAANCADESCSVAEKSAAHLAGTEARAAAEPLAATAQKVMETLKDIEFDLAVEVLYHGARQSFLKGAHRWTMFVTILLGASAAAAFGHDQICALFAATAAAADVAFDFTGGAQEHGDIRRRFLELVSKFAAEGESARSEIIKTWMVISADEPPIYRWAYEIAHINACIALGRDMMPEALPLWQRLLAQVLRG